METYQLIVLGKSGMYTYGERAASPELARLVPGYLDRGTRRLGIQRCLWGVDRDGRPIVEHSVLVEAEERPGAWTIGVQEVQ